MNTCKNCKCWKHYDDGYGERFNYCGNMSDDLETLFDIRVEVSDDTGLDVRIETGPNFGCIHFKGE